MSKKLWILVIIVLLLGGASFYSLNRANSGPAIAEEHKGEQVTMSGEEAQKEVAQIERVEENPMKAPGGSTFVNEKPSRANVNTAHTTTKTGLYEPYETTKVTLASSNHDVVLFFNARWCPSCRFVDVDIRNHLKDIPPNLTILDVDYDDSTELKQKYGVTYQHTFVQVDAQGNAIKKWSGSPTLSAIVAEVK